MTDQFDNIAADYDDDIYPLNEKEFVEPTVAKLAELATGQDILELAVGTGRIAIPLAKRGFQLAGVDISAQMLAQLHAKRKGDLVETTVADMTTVDLNKQFDLVYLIFNGITYLLELNQQVVCFQNATRHLKAGGTFVLETFIPRVDQIVKDDTAPYALEAEYLGFDKYDRINQRLTSYQYDLSGEKLNAFQTTHRYVWPSELELMGQLAGLELMARWGNWDGDELSGDHDSCIMVWQKPFNKVVAP